MIKGCGLVDGCFGTSVQMVSSVEQVESLRNRYAVDFLSVYKVQLMAPPSMTNQTVLSMQPPSEIRNKEGTDAIPIYELVTQTGQIYSSERGRYR